MPGPGARSIAPSLAALEAGKEGANLGQPRLATCVVGMAVSVGTGTGVGVGTGALAPVLGAVVRRMRCVASACRCAAQGQFGASAVEHTPIAQS